MAALLIILPHVIFDQPNSRFVENIEVERRRVLGQNAVVAGVGPSACPQRDLLWRHALQLLPDTEAPLRLVHAVGGRHLAEKRDRVIARDEESIAALAHVHQATSRTAKPRLLARHSPRWRRRPR